MASGFTYAAPGSSGHSGSGGVMGFISNLVNDTVDAGRGVIPGVEQLATHPIRAAENIGKSTWQTWSPLFHGDVSKFGHQFYDHPLAPLLDIATVFTGGASLAAKIGAKAADAGLISGDSALAKLGSMPTKVEITGERAGRTNAITRTKYLPSNPIYNAGARKLMQTADSSPFVPNWFSASKTYDRLEKADWARSGLALNAGMAAAMKAGEVFAKAGHNDWAYLERHLFSQNYMRLQDHAPTVPLKQIIDSGGKAPEGFNFVKANVDTSKPLFGTGHATSLNQFAGHLQALGKKFTTNDLKEASMTVGPDGLPAVKLAHQRALEATFQDGARSAHFLAKLYRYPTTIWKAVTLGLSPRIIASNGVGNWFMYAMRQGGAHAIKGFVDAVRYTRGDSTALKMLRETGRLPAQSHFLNHYFADELGNTFGSSALGSHTYLDTHGKSVGDVGGSLGGKPVKNGNVLDQAVQKVYQHGFYKGVHRYADVPVRAAAISAYLRGDGLVQSLMKHGKSFEDAASSALKSNPELRTRAALHARTVAGNYATLSKTEQLTRDFMPFYLWNKHIAMHATNMLRDRPAVVAAGTGVGQQGAQATRKELGNIPSWMIGDMPLGFNVNGRTALFNSSGLNPYSTVPDLVGLAQALTVGHTSDQPGDLILGTVSPVIKGLVEHTMGQKATGAPVTSHGGVIPSVLTDIFNSLRPVEIARDAAGMTPPPGKNPRLFHSDINTALSSLVGFPIQEADLGRAHQLAAQIANGGKKPKKGRGFSYGG
ncbi:MAG: hypothetical protein KGL39_15090 [Patescibacteria group bacterium]|nr:hypothetical protein [Patescibacteria group bacterium]